MQLCPNPGEFSQVGVGPTVCLLPRSFASSQDANAWPGTEAFHGETWGRFVLTFEVVELDVVSDHKAS